MYKPTSASPILKEICEKIGRQDLLPQYTQVVRVRSTGRDGQVLEENKQGRHRPKCDIEDDYPDLWVQISYRPEHGGQNDAG